MSVVFQCISSHTYYLMMVMHTQNFMIGFVTKFHYIHSKEICAKVGVNCFRVPKTPSKSQQTLLPNLMLHSKILVPKLESVALMYKKNTFKSQQTLLQISCFFWSLRMIVLDDNKVALPFHHGGHKMT